MRYAPILILLALLAMPATAEVPDDPQVWLQWNEFVAAPTFPPDVEVSYRIYWDTDQAGEPYANVTETPATEHRFTELECRAHWFCVAAVLKLDDWEVEGAKSEEVNKWPTVRPGSDPLAKGPPCWTVFPVGPVTGVRSVDGAETAGGGDE